jgi:hypothetical protein
MTSYFLLRTRGEYPAAYVEIPEGWAEEAHKQLHRLRDWDWTAKSIEVHAPWCKFLLDLGLIDDETEELLKDGHVALAKPLHDVNFVSSGWPPKVEIDKWGLTFHIGNLESWTDWLSWLELGVETDTKRCRYSDCVEAHPVANDNEIVSCPTCRSCMGLHTV